MAFHIRSNSFPSSSHPVIDTIESRLERLKSSEATSISGSSLCTDLASLKDLQEDIIDFIQLPSVQKALGQEQFSELLEGSLCLVDLCGFARDMLASIKESVLELGSYLRRNRDESATSQGIEVYIKSTKRINKMVKKYIKDLKKFGNCSTAQVNQDNVVTSLLKESQAVSLSILKSALAFVSGTSGESKKTSWSIVSKFTQSRRLHFITEEEMKINISSKRMDQDVVKQLKASEMTIQELEEGLEAFFRNLVKTRVSLLNVLNH